MQQALQTSRIVPATKNASLREGVVQVMSGAWFLPDTMLAIDVHQTKESCFSQSESPLCGFFLQNLQENSSRKSPVCSRLIPLRTVEATCSCQPLVQQ